MASEGGEFEIRSLQCVSIDSVEIEAVESSGCCCVGKINRELFIRTIENGKRKFGLNKFAIFPASRSAKREERTPSAINSTKWRE